MTGFGTITVLYNYDGSKGIADFNDATTKQPFVGDTTRAPIKAGEYLVKVVLRGATNIDTTGGKDSINLGLYYINDPLPPTIDEDITALTVRQGRPANLTVKATSPNSGTLGYQWYEVNDAGDKKVGTNSATFAAPTAAMGSKSYYVIVTNSKSGVQDPAYDTSGVAQVEVIEPPVTLNSTNAVIELSKTTWTYNGYTQALGGTDVVVKYISKDETTGLVDTTTLTENTDYTLSYSNAVNVGTSATIRVTGVNDYAGSLSKTFTIVKKDVEGFDFSYVDERAYTGDSIGAEVKLVAPLTNSGGTITVYYDGGNGKSTAKPVDVGFYEVEVDVTDGANLTAGTGIYLGSYVITKGVLDTACFTYKIPVGHKQDQTEPFGIGSVTWKKGTGYGEFEILYNGDKTVPKVDGVYTVSAAITGGDNFDEGSVVLGVYTIGGTVTPPDAVKGGDRVIPGKTGTTEAAVAPVKVVASGFTAGPSPVSKGGVIKFFSAKAVKSGSLYIFDQNGNAVEKVVAKSGTGEIGSWTANASEGTYVVKGALTGKDGTREKVSFVFVVVR
jgi:hypothetical protein